MAAIQKVIIFGATGNTGLCCVQAALDLGYETTAFVRDVAKLPDDLKSKVNVIVGDATNYDDVVKALEGQDGVVIALGTRNDLTFLFYEPSDLPERFIDLNADHARMLEVLKSSDREWTAILPPHIADSEPTGNPLITHDKRGPTRVISKHDLGHALVECLTSEEHLKRVCGICNP